MFLGNATVKVYWISVVLSIHMGTQGKTFQVSFHNLEKSPSGITLWDTYDLIRHEIQAEKSYQCN